MYMMPLYCK